MYVYSRVYLVILIFVICIDKINVYALPVWRLIKDIYIYIDGKHDNDSLSENVVVLFNKYYCKSHMSQSL